MLETGAVTDVIEINFPAGLPGFPDAHRFNLVPWGPDGSPFVELTSLDDEEVGFVVVPPWVFHPEYEFELDDLTAERLNVREPEDVVVFAMVTLRERPDDATLNLLGPIVVNRFTHDAAQVVLATSAYSTHSPLALAG